MTALSRRDKKQWQYPPLIGWDSYPPGLRDKHDFGSSAGDPGLVVQRRTRQGDATAAELS
ncbi:hypothetical protein [Amycolatopsis coloradensis]|uniref:hypothetical protein n=1 Tax=Amycolatopsis coloradensis TaxID=76021 RepID=UPI00142E763D|nr:hypothetical protein [Amycolatopsis coloradensis]